MTMVEAPPGKAIPVGMGQIAVSAAPNTLTSVLGSCIGVSLYDERLKVGALAHVVLPTASGTPDDPGKYADTAIPAMLEQLRKKGAGKSRLVAKLAGGAAMFGGKDSMKIGVNNAEAIVRLLGEHEIPIRGQHVGGNKGRRATFDLTTGQFRVDMVGESPVVM
jgi:chemotaxis protein CheD